MKVLTLDIETRPNLAYVWGLWDQNVGLNQVEQYGSVISWAAKWHDQRKVMFASVHHDGRTSMLEQIHALICEADVIVGWNSKQFDMKHLNREFILEGMPPPTHYVDIDLMQVVKQRFKFASNKLQHVADALGMGGKLQHDGFPLWIGCMNDDPRSWATMRRYNKQDVILTDKLYTKLLPWIKTHPHQGLYGGDVDACPRCGGTDLIKRGYYTTRVSKFQTMQCKTCEGYHKGKEVIARANTTSI